MKFEFEYLMARDHYEWITFYTNQVTFMFASRLEYWVQTSDDQTYEKWTLLSGSYKRQ